MFVHMYDIKSRKKSQCPITKQLHATYVHTCVKNRHENE